MYGYGKHISKQPKRILEMKQDFESLFNPNYAADDSILSREDAYFEYI